MKVIVGFGNPGNKYNFTRHNLGFLALDLLIVRDDQITNVCETKYSKADYHVNAEFDRDMKRKISDYLIDSRTKHAIHATLITNYGVVENEYTGELQSIITGEELFK